MSHLRVVGLVVGLACMGCDEPAPDPDPDAGPEVQVLRLATWYSVPGELEALQEMINDYAEANPGALVEVVPVPIAPAGRTEALSGDLEWDIAMQTAPFLADTDALTVDLNTIPALAGGSTRVLTRFQPLVQPAEKLRGVPVSVIRLNSLIYDLDTMPTPPQTIGEWRTVCETYAASDRSGPAPLANIAPEGIDPRSHLVTMLGLLPPELVNATLADPTPAFREVVELLEFYRDNECIYFAHDDNGGGGNWDDAVHALITGNASMIIAPDWGAGYLIANGLVAGTDFATASALDTSAYVSTVEIMLLNAASTRQAEAAAFLEVAFSPTSQISFGSFRGSIPALTIANPSTDIGDDGVRAHYAAFLDAEATGRFVTQTPWIASATKPAEFLEPFMAGTIDADAVIAGYLADYPPPP